MKTTSSSPCVPATLKSIQILLPSVFFLLWLTPVNCMAAGGGGAGAMSPNPDTKELKERMQASEARGKISFDFGKNNSDGEPGAVKLHPGSSMRWDWPEKDIPGKWRLRVYDDGSVPEKLRKDTFPPLAGISDSTGRMVSVGPVYESQPEGKEIYGLYTFNHKDRKAAGKVQKLESRREIGWQEWEFVMNRNRQLQIFLNGKLQRTLESDEHGLKGISSLSLEVPRGKDGAQNLWISGFRVMQERTPAPQAGGRTGIGF